MLTLKRVSHTQTETFGVLLWSDVPFAVTLEDPWRENQPFVSCIPKGNYVCKRKISPKFGETFEITSVPGRSHVLFHAGNTHKDTEGCVLLGKEFGPVNGLNGILEPKPAFDLFMAKLKGINQFNLIITA